MQLNLAFLCMNRNRDAVERHASALATVFNNAGVLL